MYFKALKNPWKYAPWILFLAGLWFSVIQNMGVGFAYIPGDLLDNRFNNYILEHFYRWITGIETSYWNAGIFYPFPNTIAFSDNLLGTAPIYAGFRGLGLDRETAFQAWYIFGFIFNFVSAFYVLQRMGTTSLAGGVGAFFYTFGLPIMAQEVHAQLIYRCGVPLACYFLWEFFEEPNLWKLLVVGLSSIWQLYASMYNGIFLALLLLAMLILFPFFMPSQNGTSILLVLPGKLRHAWKEAPGPWRVIFVISSTALLMCLFLLLQPYYSVTRTYGFTRTLPEIFSMLPETESYLLADASIIWGKLSTSMHNIKYLRWEHQLFPGLTVVTLILAGLIWQPKWEYRTFVWLHLGAMLMLMVVTFNFHGYSVYSLLGILPGMNSIRAVTRVVLILMWPAAVLITSTLDSMLDTNFSNKIKAAPWLAYIFITLLLVETLAFRHLHFSKEDAKSRLTEIKNGIPIEIPQEPILVLHIAPQDWYSEGLNEIDVILAAQDLGWPTLNGYSGNYPKGYVLPSSCQDVSDLILAYMRFAGITDHEFYTEMINRTVPVGFIGCDLH